MAEYSMILLVLVAMYCFVRGALDIRQRRYIAGLIGIALGAVLAIVPIPTHSVIVDLPEPAASP